MTQLEQFFFDNAGVGWNPQTETQEQGKTRGAAELAKAMHYALDHNLIFEWDADEDGCQCEDCDHADCQYCQVWDGENMLGSLSGICGAMPEYRRVVEAELALEAMHTLEGK